MDCVEGPLQPTKWTMLKAKSEHVVANLRRQFAEGGVHANQFPLTAFIFLCMAFNDYRSGSQKFAPDYRPSAVNNSTDIWPEDFKLYPPVSYVLDGDVNYRVDRIACFVVLLLAVVYWLVSFAVNRREPKHSALALFGGYLSFVPLALFVPLAFRFAPVCWTPDGFARTSSRSGCPCCSWRASSCPASAFGWPATG
ncbi:hypothetical protein M3Y99_00742700 [Aphelenchoides fujianensis]|nr:hypothetical protein M3Y99_00742700 [Aphelenchoides fujianensis]